MDYNLEALGDERFQKLCQAILAAAHPNVQCMPVGQPDGGRDAFVREGQDVIIFQVKYSRNPAQKTERDAIMDLIKSEKSKIKNLVRRGAVKFYFMTNVSGTSHLERGSIDKANDILSEAFEIPSYCFWRDDIERRVESIPGLIWRYSEIFRGADFLEILASAKSNPKATSSTNTFRAYASAQYMKDSEVRFQQVQIQNSLLDLFTDTPIGAARDKLPPANICLVQEEILEKISSTSQRHYYAHDEGFFELAAHFLLSIAPERGLQRIVLEGAPGQGKSTVTQYLAQVHRMRNLSKNMDLEKVPDGYKSVAVRLPLRVDLRDYAMWLTGSDPFAAEKDVPRPTSGLDSIESFLSHQVHSLAGGRVFDVNNLMTILSNSHCLLILDGFDEVADKSTRSKLMEQIRLGAERIGSDCTSIQIIVTSRPAAFIMSPGFLESEWLHLSLLPMRLNQISKYADKWIEARHFQQNEGREFKELLLDRVERAHIRSLAQNPMQLAILLNLISTKGRSLPDKRTALYDSYMDMFFGREAEKDATVRENRDILIQLHQYIAWCLSLDAETPGGSGSISQADLESLVRKYLNDKGHEGDVLRLFTGAVERVGALVSRVQGMLEFEVQPLREYFTGRFLYETAPYSPPGAERGGARPQRFDALARRPYWLNVARFYSGCYNSGELSSLVSGLEQIAETGDLRLVDHSVQLAILLVNDWVFAQEPKTVRDVVEFIASPKHLRTALASPISWQEERLVFPERSGRKELAARVTSEFIGASEISYRRRAGMVLRVNLGLDDRWRIWQNLRDAGQDAFSHATSLGLFWEVGGDQQRELIELYGDKARWAFIASGRWDVLTKEDRRLALFSDPPASDEFGALRELLGPVRFEKDLYKAFILINSSVLDIIHYGGADGFPLDAFLQRAGFDAEDKDRDTNSVCGDDRIASLVATVREVGKKSIGAWRTSLEPWSKLVEGIRVVWGDDSRALRLAAIAAGVVSKREKASKFEALFNAKLPLVERSRYARLKTSTVWWRRKLAEAETETEKLLVSVLALSWASGSVIRALTNEVSYILDRLDQKCWRTLLSVVQSVISSTARNRQPLSGFKENWFGAIASPRLSALLVLRMPRYLAAPAFANLLDSFDGKDIYLGVFLAEQGLEEVRREPRIWKNMIAFFKKFHIYPSYYHSYLPVRPGVHYYRRSEGMPVALAAQISKESGEVPLELLEFALFSLAKSGKNSMESIGTVSRIENWL
jgi:hypothetical protein